MDLVSILSVVHFQSSNHVLLSQTPKKKNHCVDFRPEIKHFFRSKMSEIIRFCISVRYVDLLVVICFVRERFFFWGGYLATDLILYWTCHLVGSIEMNKVMNKSWG